MLRAVNVGGTGKMAMADLKAATEAAGFEDVKTHGNTGNVAFTAKERSAEKVRAKLARQLKADIGYAGDVFVLSHAQLAKTAQDNPFRADLESDSGLQCYLAFLDGKPAAKDVKVVEADDQDGLYRIRVVGQVLYYAYAKADAANRKPIDGERILKLRATARSWKVVDKLVALTA
jgi:uncharacterized protein (DUF1697 family)